LHRNVWASGDDVAIHLIPKAHWCESITGFHPMATPLPLSTAQHHVSLSNHDKQQLIDFVASHCSAPADLTDQQVWALVQRYPVPLPSIQAELDALVNNEITYLLIQNLPIEPLPAPPSNGIRPAAKGWLSETILFQLVLASRLQPYSYVEERNGSLVQEVVPTAERTGELSSLGSVALNFHSDKGFLNSPFRPEYLCLIGLLNHSTPTLFTDLDEALATLRRQDPALVEFLGQPLFRIGRPASLRGDASLGLMSEARPLVVNHQGFNNIGGNLQTLVATDRLAQRALAALEVAVNQVSRPILIGAGQCCLVNNMRALHARAAIQGGPRWLQRIYARSSLLELQLATDCPGGIIFSMADILNRAGLGMDVMHERIAHNFPLDLASAEATPVALTAPAIG
jgi:hypothetical protein